MSKGMVDRNPHTGEALRSKHTSDAYRNNFDEIFKKCSLCGDGKSQWDSCKIRNCPHKVADDTSN